MNDFLFVCQENRLRSPTCEHVARLLGYSADSAGTSVTAIRPVSALQIERAFTIVCMEQYQAQYIRSIYPLHHAEIEIWNIPDEYAYCDAKLIAFIEAKLKGRGKYEPLR